jgi:endonuclease/exonuclease/phosphatase family metal-dependent hydrolase
MIRTLLAGLVTLALSAGCANPVRMAIAPGPHADCRAEVLPQDTSPVTWIAPQDSTERRALDERCAQVGTPLIAAAPERLASAAHRVVVATWNMHDGRGDLLSLVDSLRRGVPGQPAPDAVVILLQEVVRARRPAQHAAPGHSSSHGATGVRDIPSLVAPLGWHFAYLPGRRNRLRPEGAADADRGIAILSSLPLSDLEAIELPLERQRRVALSAVVTGRTSAGRDWRLRVVSVHLENRSGARRVWARAGASRTRQTEALLDALALSPTTAAAPSLPIVVGGDFNTWMGQREHALRLLKARFEPWPGEDTRPTIGVRQWRLDYLFPKLPLTVRTTHRRLDALYGSDHYPVVAGIDFGAT